MKRMCKLHTSSFRFKRIKQCNNEINENGKVKRRSAPQRHVTTHPVQLGLGYNTTFNFIHNPQSQHNTDFIHNPQSRHNIDFIHKPVTSQR